MHSTSIRLACYLLIVMSLVAPQAAVAASEVVLPRAWYDIVDPYRYDEPRRFEAGWNRGADVHAAGGIVRTPVAGRVRFVGDIAGRRIATITTMVGGVPAVATFTGLAAHGVEEGDWVRAGAVIGRGDLVHIGAYDRARRSRYLPIVAALATVPGGEAWGGAVAVAAGAAHPRVGISGAIADRLESAIAGTALLGTSGGYGRSDGAAPIGARAPVSRPDAASTAAVESSAVPAALTSANPAAQSLRAVPPALDGSKPRALQMAAAETVTRGASATTTPLELLGTAATVAEAGVWVVPPRAHPPVPSGASAAHDSAAVVMSAGVAAYPALGVPSSEAPPLGPRRLLSASVAATPAQTPSAAAGASAVASHSNGRTATNVGAQRSARALDQASPGATIRGGVVLVGIFAVLILALVHRRRHRSMPLVLDTPIERPFFVTSLHGTPDPARVSYLASNEPLEVPLAWSDTSRGRSIPSRDPSRQPVEYR